MKKTLLFALGAFLLGSASAHAVPTMELVPGFCGTKVSPDGRYIGSSYLGVILIKDLQTGVVYEYGDGTIENSFGHCNAFSKVGTAVGSMGDVAAIWDGSDFRILDEDSPYSLSYANAITPDGTRVVGDVSNPGNDEGQEGQLLVPVYWDVNPDGTVSDAVILPHPKLDFTGRKPIYVTALSVSENGKTIIGQVMDYSGAVCTPIVYTQDDSGEWSYSEPGAELVNTLNLELPEYPEEIGPGPDPKDFMTPENLEAYNNAYQEWLDSNYTTEYPEYGYYMSAEEIEAYNSAATIYNEKAEEFNAKIDAYLSTFREILSCSALFTFNSVVASPDGKKFVIAVTVQSEEMWGPDSSYQIYFDLEKGTYTEFRSDLNLSPTTCLNDGTIISSVIPSGYADPTPVASYVKAAGSDSFVAFEDFIAARNPVFGEWMNDNLRHDYESVDMDTYEPIIVEKHLFVGQVRCSDDMNVFLGLVESYGWLDLPAGDMPADYSSYVIVDDQGSGIHGVRNDSVSDVTVRCIGSGVLRVEGDAVDGLSVYDLSGRLVFVVSDIERDIPTGLNSGVYVVKVSSNGTSSTIKVVI